MNVIACYDWKRLVDWSVDEDFLDPHGVWNWRNGTDIEKFEYATGLTREESSWTMTWSGFDKMFHRPWMNAAERDMTFTNCEQWLDGHQGQSRFVEKEWVLENFVPSDDDMTTQFEFVYEAMTTNHGGDVDVIMHDIALGEESEWEWRLGKASMTVDCLRLGLLVPIADVQGVSDPEERFSMNLYEWEWSLINDPFWCLDRKMKLKFARPAMWAGLNFWTPAGFLQSAVFRY